ncbi:MAG TPA: TonB family protein [Candidatus Aquilonibacter sp.]|nr:TonB family protein [Candidatus Aquilonibacter sp.]
MKRSGNRILTYCLALSLFAHLIAAAVFRPLPRVDAKPEQRPTRVSVTEIHPTPPPTPPPTPVPTRPPVATAPKPRPARRPSVHPPRIADRPGGTGSTPAYQIPSSIDDGNPQGDPGPVTPSTPTPSPKPACANPDVPASTINVVAPTVPESATDVGDAEAQVRVTLEPSGAVAGANIYRSAGDPLLDREAVRVARQSTYRPEIRDCVAVSGEYLFTVDFKE